MLLSALIMIWYSTIDSRMMTVIQESNIEGNEENFLTSLPDLLLLPYLLKLWGFTIPPTDLPPPKDRACCICIGAAAAKVAYLLIAGTDGCALLPRAGAAMALFLRCIS